jgi:hypothetical protein
MATKKTARTNESPQRGPARKTVGAKPTRRHESWKKVLQRSLIREGYSPTKAKELDAISAA